jgi:hypothetical protein
MKFIAGVLTGVLASFAAAAYFGYRLSSDEQGIKKKMEEAYRLGHAIGKSGGNVNQLSLFLGDEASA